MEYAELQRHRYPFDATGRTGQPKNHNFFHLDMLWKHGVTDKIFYQSKTRARESYISSRIDKSG
jgi:hypothetical protein